jgi:hypothetical protein
MAKSFCDGCMFLQIAEQFDNRKFHYCAKFITDKLQVRKEKCNGKYKITEEQ